MTTMTLVDPTLQQYIQTHSLQQRQNISDAILSKYEIRIPILVGRAELKRTPAITKNKFIVPREITFGQFIFEVRKHIPELKSTDALFFFLSNGTLSQTSELMSVLYAKYKSDDGFMYITYSSENTFGKS